MSALTVEFEQNERDLVEFQHHYVRRGAGRWRTLGPVAIFGATGLMMGSLAVLTLLGRDMTVTLILGVPALLMLLFAVMTFTIIWFVMPGLTTTLSLSTPDSRLRLLGGRAVSIAPGGVSWRFPVGDGSMGWSGVSRVEASIDAVYIYIGGSTAVLVPLRAFASEDDFRRFSALAHQYFSQSRGLR